MTHQLPAPRTTILVELSGRSARLCLGEHGPLLKRRGVTFFTLPNTQPRFKAAALTPGLGSGSAQINIC